MTCICKEWRENISKIDGPIELLAIRSGTRGYDGVIFKYCPWCGNLLKDTDNPFDKYGYVPEPTETLTP